MIAMKDYNILYIDCKTGNVRKQEIPKLWRENYIGGTGINTKILYESGAVYEDAMSEKNVLIFGIGPAVGTKLLAGNRCTITAKSPLTDMYGDSSTGGHFVINMKSLHIEHIVLEGKADKPSYVYIKKDGTVVLEDAQEIWGMYSGEVTDFLRQKHGLNCEVACIGPAGEKGVRYASVIVSKYHAAGKMGMGCVMGSKNIKAVVIESKPLKIKPYNKEKFNKIVKLWYETSKQSVITKSESIDGSLFLVKKYNEANQLPVKNCQQGTHEKAKDLYADHFAINYSTKKLACYSCLSKCGRAYEIKEGRYKGEGGKRIDYGAAVSAGPAVGIFEWDKIIHLKLLVDEIGVDSMEVAGAISLFMEGCQRKLISEEYLQERQFEFGNADDVEYLIKLIGKREGIGDILGEGTYRAGKILNLEKYAMCIKKSSTGSHSKDKLAWSLGYVTSTRGGDHLKGFPFTTLMGGYWSNLVMKYIFHPKEKVQLDKPERQGRVIWWHENYKTVLDALGLCLFSTQALPNLGHAYFDEFAEVMNCLYGTELNDKDIFYAAERIYQLQNMFNISCGMNIDDYKFPLRSKDKDIDKEYIENTTIEVLNNPGMLPEYFKFRGLSELGKPTMTRMKELNLVEESEMFKELLEEGDFSLEDALKEVSLNAKFSNLENKIAFGLSNFLVRMLGNKEKQRDRIKIKKLKYNK